MEFCFKIAVYEKCIELTFTLSTIAEHFLQGEVAKLYFGCDTVPYHPKPELNALANHISRLHLNRFELFWQLPVLLSAAVADTNEVLL